MSLPLALALTLAPLVQDPAPDATSKECHIHGRVVDADGEPVHLAKIATKGWGANQARLEEFGQPVNWQDPEVFTDEDGRFDLRFVPPQAYQFTVKILHDDFAELGWRWSRIEEGEERDQGTVVLPKPAVIEGHVEGAGGDLLVEGWRVMASMHDRPPEYGGVSTKHAAMDPATGGFRIDDLPPGKVRIEALRSSGERTERQIIETKEGGVTRVLIRFDGPDPSTSIKLAISSRGPAGAATSQLQAGALHAIAEDGTRYPFERIPQRGWEYATRALLPGLYRVQVSDSRFETWFKDDVRPGESVRAQLTGRAALRVTVVDEEGEPVPAYRLLVRQIEPFSTSRVDELASARTPPPPRGLYTGLLEGSFEITVEAEGFADWRGEARGVTADEVSELRVELRAPRVLTGRILRSDGRPLEVGSIEYTLGPVAGHDRIGSISSTSMEIDGEWRQVNIPYRDASSRIAADGSFDLGPVGGGLAVLRIRVGEHLVHDVDLVLEEQELPLTITLPPIGQLRGIVRLVGDRPRGDIEVLVRSEERSRTLGDLGISAATPVDEDGRFVVRDLVAGTYVVSAQVTEAPPQAPAAENVMHGRAERRRTIVERRLAVAPGTHTEIVLDEALKPQTGVVLATLTLGGGPLSEGAVARMRPIDRFDDAGFALVGACAEIIDGIARLEKASVGSHRLVVSSPAGWNHEFDGVVVTEHSESSVTFDVPAVRRTLRVVDGGGAAVGARTIAIGPPNARFRMQAHATDERGEVELTLPAGEYALAAEVPDPETSISARLSLTPFTWAAGEGALVVELPVGQD